MHVIDRFFGVPASTAEFRLAVACALWPPSEQRAVAIREAARQVVDWPRFLRVVQRQRIMGLAENGLAQAGVVMLAREQSEIQKLTFYQLEETVRFALESHRLQRLFRARGISPIFLKGVSLAMLAYGDLGLRQAKDIDFMIPRGTVHVATTILHDAGYIRTRPEANVSAELLKLWMKHEKDLQWVHPGLGTVVEVHWALTSAKLLGSFDTTHDTQMVEVTKGINLQTLDHDFLFAYLCVHGAGHCWDRLKWIADIHALLALKSEEAIELMYDRALELGAARAPGQALLLCQSLFGLRLGNRLNTRLLADWRLRVLHRLAQKVLLRSGSEVETSHLPWGSSLSSLSRFFLADGWSFLIAEASRTLFPISQLIDARLPMMMWSLFPLIRAATWLRNRLIPRAMRHQADAVVRFRMR